MQAYILGMRAELEPCRSKYLVALAKPGHSLAYRLDFSGELHPQYLDLLLPPKSGHESDDEWNGPPHPPVPCRNRRRMNADKDPIVLGNWLFDVLDLHDLRGAVSTINGGFHAALACSFHLCYC